MECRSWLNDPTVLIVADASVVINLNATGCSGTILDALPNRCAVPEQVALELEDGRRNGHNDADGLDELVAACQVEIVRLSNHGLQHFRTLVLGPAAQTLDDGEAATIAYALEQNAVALIDERKANRLCSERFNALHIGCTVDVLMHAAIEATLGRIGLAEAVFNALYNGRMRVPAHHVGWVVNLIGSERAEQCASLPRSVRRVEVL
ncbi:MAG: hypothetical protein F4148_00125 [Caldilineaceae bacterium SB0675_bin_29]|uniref:DUF3368 domain-containing protein n=1 Tax=Caldilineaceae bacterium SB0675_bin_29 TaxID=2605266 RepID=A0A6B1FY92_9CHLR|nr:hypothetical protein [Caldilineaceae bacterium SB0675_bin_29]